MTQKELMKLLHYSAETGMFTWNLPKSNRRKEGELAGSIGDSGYRTIMINGINHLAPLDGITMILPSRL